MRILGALSFLGTITQRATALACETTSMCRIGIEGGVRDAWIFEQHRAR